MPLVSNLLSGNARLQQCLVSDPAHVKPNDTGEHVRLIQIALEVLDGLSIGRAERTQKLYGTSTAEAVLAYKRKRKIINHSYQSSEDNIVGKMTIASLDKEMYEREHCPPPGMQKACRRKGALAMIYIPPEHPVA